MFGGEPVDLESHQFGDAKNIDVVDIFASYDEAEKAWRAKAQQTVDNAHARYFIVHLRRFLEPIGLNRKYA